MRTGRSPRQPGRAGRQGGGPGGARPLRIRLPPRVTPAEAARLQERYRHRVLPAGGGPRPRTVAGVDASYRGERARAAVSVHSFPDLRPLAVRTATGRVAFPYVPGLLAFREAPVLLAALEKLDALPDLLLVDGQGLLHPRRFGLACLLGVALDLPAIGVAKSRLLGEGGEPGPCRGARAPVRDAGEIVGSAVRTRAGVRPVFVSVGHRVGLETAVRLVLETAPRCRIPEPLRHAHRAAAWPRGRA